MTELGNLEFAECIGTSKARAFIGAFGTYCKLASDRKHSGPVETHSTSDGLFKPLQQIASFAGPFVWLAACVAALYLPIVIAKRRRRRQVYKR